MTDEPLVSVIIPTFNRAGLLPAAIDSVLAQSYTNWELIVWDDGSTDSTREVVGSFADTRIRYFHHSNVGVSCALNQAIKVARGCYVAFLDDDDQWTEDKLRTQVGVLERFPGIDLLFADFVNVNLSAGAEGLCFQQNALGLRGLTTEEVATRVFLVHDGMPQSLLRAQFIGFDTVVVREAVLRATGGFNEELRNSQDLELWWRMGLAGVTFGYVDDVLLKRFKHPGSLSSPDLAAYRNRIRALDCCLSHTLAGNRHDLVPAIRHAYHRAWRQMTHQYALRGDRPNAIRALGEATRYGLSWPACYALLAVLAGPGMASLARGCVRRLKRRVRGPQTERRPQ